jgi:mono/diheme cytochrome c family protein
MRRLAGTVAAGAALAVVTGVRPAAAQAPDGQALYQQHCRKCHGATGTPTTRIAEMYPEIKPLSQMTRVSADSIVVLVTNGAGKEMKPFKDKMTPEEMRAVSQYALTLAKPRTP